MSWCEWWWVLKVCCSLRVVEEISKADWMELKGIFLKVGCVILEMEFVKREREKDIPDGRRVRRNGRVD